MKKFLFLAVVIAITAGCSKMKEQQKTAPIAVKTMTVSAIPTGTGQSYSGTVVPQAEATLSFSSEGVIRSLNFKQGQMVKAGQVLGTVDITNKESSLAASQAGTETARSQLAQAQDLYDRAKMLHDEDAITEQKWVMAQENLRRAKAMLKQAESMEKISTKRVADTRLTAPFSGYISAKLAEVGQNASPANPVAKLMKINPVRVKISVPEDDISKISIGRKVYIRVEALDNELRSGVITEKSLSADPLAHSYEVMAEVVNDGNQLLPGMICEMFTDQGTGKETILLPAELVQIDYHNRYFVWTVQGNKAQRTPVTIGKNHGDKVEITGGLALGAKVISEGQQKVSTGMEVKTQETVWGK